MSRIWPGRYLAARLRGPASRRCLWQVCWTQREARHGDSTQILHVRAIVRPARNPQFDPTRHTRALCVCRYAGARPALGRRTVRRQSRRESGLGCLSLPASLPGRVALAKLLVA